MIKVGMLLADRYEILEKVGTGGMADVYKAKDHTLNRFVAVKVLKQEFSENANFVSKFRVEAQAAGGLQHPSIVGIYDVGEERGDYFIVMELIDGITLKEYILKKGGLPYEEAVTIAIQVAMGLEVAHKGGIIHRDIKPQNIIISRDGKVKVTDFGIAKAATSDTISSNVMGSVHYTSPEQARGGYSDAKSDIYSLGVTLFEMITGHVPFDGDTTVAIAIKHIQNPMPSPRDYCPDLPVAVEQIIMKCCEKSPDRRYQCMEDLSSDLKHALVNPNGDFVKRYNPEDAGQTRMITEEEQRRIKNSTDAGRVAAANAAMTGGAGASAAGTGARAGAGNGAKAGSGAVSGAGNGSANPVKTDLIGGQASVNMTGGEDDDVRTDRYGSRRRAGQPAATAAGADTTRPIPGIDTENGAIDTGYDNGYDDPEAGVDDGYDEESRVEKSARVLSIIAAVIIGFIVVLIVLNRLGFLTFSAGNNNKPQQVEATEMVIMPVVVGQNVDVARKALVAEGLIPEINYVDSTEYAADIVMSASEKEGTEVAKGTTVVLTVCGTSGIEVPDVVGDEVESAKTTLTEAGFQVNVQSEYNEEVEENHVISQDPSSGINALANSVVTIVVSKGPDLTNKAEMPNLLGYTEEEARAALTEAGLRPGNVRTDKTADIADRGLVVSQDVTAGTYIEKGTAVNFAIGGRQTYSFSSDITAPSASEDADYRSGTAVHVKIVSDEDGAVLLDTTTSAFPYRVSYTGIPSSSGTLTMTYSVTLTKEVDVDNTQDNQEMQDPELGPADGESTSTTGTTTVEYTEERTITRALNFSAEN